MILYPELIWETDMGRFYGMDLRRRVIEAIDGGMSARSAAARYSVAASTAINWRRRWREEGSFEPFRQGQPPGSKLDAHEAFIFDLVETDKDIALHEISGIRHAIEAAGAELRFLPPYSPGFNPIEMAFSKLKAALRKAAARTIPEPWDVIADAIEQFKPEECQNYFAAAGYDQD